MFESHLNRFELFGNKLNHCGAHTLLNPLPRAPNCVTQCRCAHALPPPTDRARVPLAAVPDAPTFFVTVPDPPPFTPPPLQQNQPTATVQKKFPHTRAHSKMFMPQATPPSRHPLVQVWWPESRRPHRVYDFHHRHCPLHGESYRRIFPFQFESCLTFPFPP
jgi:hypothetical protein